MQEITQDYFDNIVKKLVKKSEIYEAVFYISSDNGEIDINSAFGELVNTPKYFIASINKLFISAIIFKLKAENKLKLSDKLSEYFPAELIKGIHIYKGTDYSNSLTIEHLLSQTSGLPCFLLDKQIDGKVGMKELELGNDRNWNILEIINTIKQMEPTAPPGAKARYINTNHQLLNYVVEKVTGNRITDELTNLIKQLDLKDTYVITDNLKSDFNPIRFKNSIVQLPKFLTSCENEIISTATDQMKFIKAFFSGLIFPKSQIIESSKWQNIFFPFKYGIGIQKFSLPRILSPFAPVPELLGHNGSTGSFAFYAPKKGVYITGTTNQQSKSSAPYQSIIRILMKIKNIV